MVVAELGPGAEESLRPLLATLKREPGVVDPDNALVPFRQLQQLHFARFVILRDLTTAELAEHGESFPDVPPLLAFLGDGDGPTEFFLLDLATSASDGLTRIFSHCRDFKPSTPLVRWMIDRNVQPAVQHANWVERRVLQVHEEASR